MKVMDKEESVNNNKDEGDEIFMRGKRVKVSLEEWKIIGFGFWRKRIKKSRIFFELFLRVVVRLFIYRNFVKEIVLIRYVILDGEIVVN